MQNGFRAGDSKAEDGGVIMGLYRDNGKKVETTIEGLGLGYTRNLK